MLLPVCGTLTLAVNGNQVTATAPANISLDGRSAKIVLKAGGAETTVTAIGKFDKTKIKKILELVN